ncbi:MAG: C40 family peptidase [Candidatus Accumulibacter sp.]|nr:C40 family peptidase [Accumulibacter sp.]
MSICLPGSVSQACAETAPRQSDDELTLLLARYTDKTEELVRESLEHIGVDYSYGGTSPDEGFDCSGFVQWVFRAAVGENLPRTAKAQSQAGRSVRKNELQPGDLIFFNTLRRAFSHVGVYLGDGHFIHSPRRGAYVRVDDMRKKYWAQRFNGARRVFDDTTSWAD